MPMPFSLPKPRFKLYWKIWRMIATNALQEALLFRITNLFFIFGKVFRLAMTLLLLFLFRSNVDSFGAYTIDQVFAVFLTYNLVDILAQTLFRGVYVFGREIQTGSFDFLLLKPMSPLFRALMGKPDINDALFLFPTLALTVYFFATLNLTITPVSAIAYVLLILNGVVIATCLHTLIVAATIVFTQIDGVIWLYRDVTGLGRFPITTYREPLRSILLFVVPVGVMSTLPANVLVGVSPLQMVVPLLLFGAGFVAFTHIIWKQTLKWYSGAGG